MLTRAQLLNLASEAYRTPLPCEYDSRTGAVVTIEPNGTKAHVAYELEAENHIINYLLTN
jgi:hypothetical protein